MITNVLSYLEAAAARCSTKIAVREPGKHMTFAQWEDYSRRVGSALAKDESVHAPVGVFMDKGIDALCACLGAVYAGAYYSVLNPELPDARLEQVDIILGTKKIITTESYLQRAKELFPGATLYFIDDLKSGPLDTERLEHIRKQLIDMDPLYINFTSGSTGIPKGIVVSHRSVIDFMECFAELFSIGEEDVIANQAPFDFDVSVKDIYSCLKTTATLVIVPRRLFSMPTKLLDYLCDQRVTTLIWAVSALCLISSFHALDYRTPSSVTKVLFSGEVMPLKHLREWQRHLPDAMFVNLYGPTEITCNCAYHILNPNRDYSDGVPIGKPFPNEDVFLLDRYNRIVTQAGVEGMIAVRGTALALGYYRLPEKTNHHFVQNPLQQAYQERIYLTGDIGKYDKEGNLLYCGRKDNQIKYMGHRIELEEVEHTVNAVHGIERCCCVFQKEKSQLHLFYTGGVEPAILHQTMRKSLPVYMVPSLLHRVDTMPLSKNGKIDRKKLLEEIR